MRVPGERSAALFSSPGELPELRGLAVHSDLRVRMEAIKSLFAFDTKVPSTLLDDIFEDPDPKVGQDRGRPGGWRF